MNPDAVTVHQDAAVYATLLDPGQPLTHRFRPGFQGYLFVVHGSARRRWPRSDEGDLDEGGAAKVQDEPEVDGPRRRGRRRGPARRDEVDRPVDVLGSVVETGEIR